MEIKGGEEGDVKRGEDRGKEGSILERKSWLRARWHSTGSASDQRSEGCGFEAY